MLAGPADELVDRPRIRTPLALEHTHSHGRRNHLEGGLTELLRDASIGIELRDIPLHEIHRSKLLALAADQLILHRHRRYDPRSRILLDTPETALDEALEHVAAERCTIGILHAGLEVLGLRADNAGWRNVVQRNRLVEFVQVLQPKHVVETGHEKRKPPALIPTVRSGQRVGSGGEEVLVMELDKCLLGGSFQEHLRRVFEIHRIAAKDGVPDVIRHLVVIKERVGQPVVLDVHVLRIAEDELEFPALRIRSRLVVDLVLDTLMALGTGADEVLAVPLVFLALDELLEGHHPAATFRRAEQHTGDRLLTRDEHVAHGGKFHTDEIGEIQQIVLVDQHGFDICNGIRVGGLVLVRLSDVDAGNEIRDHLLDDGAVLRIAIPEPLRPDKHLVDGAGVDVIRPSPKGIETGTPKCSCYRICLICHG